jgi:TRAP-type transport system small permease protein
MRADRMENVLTVFKAVDSCMLRFTKVISIVAFIILTILITANVFVRFFPIVSLHWFDEIIELLVAYMVFYGSAALWISREHFSVGDLVEKRIHNPRLKSSYRLMLELLNLLFVVILFYYSLRLAFLATDVTNVFAIPKRVLYSCLPISGFIMIVSSIGHILKEFACIVEPQREVIERVGR